jgi:tetratricopeptide (TPR) repeat protein
MIKKIFLAFILFIGTFTFSGGSLSLAAEVPPQPDFTFETEAVPEDPALLRLQRGDQAMREGLYENAILNFREYRRFVGNRQPDLSRALGKLTEAYLAAGNLPSAIQSLQEEKKNRAALPDPMLAWLIYLEAQILFKQGNWSACLGVLSAQAEDFGYGIYSDQVLLLRLDCLAQLEQWQQLIGILEKHLQEPGSGTFALQSRLIKAYLAAGKASQAMARLAEISGKVTVAEEFEYKVLQVMSLAASEQIDQAFTLFQEIRSRCPEEPDADWWRLIWYLAETGYRLKRYSEAEAAYRQGMLVAVNADGRGKCLQRIADCQILQDKITQARQTLEEYRQSYPERPEYITVTMRLAELLQKTDNTLKAAELYGELVDHPRVPVEQRYQAAIQRATCLVRDGQYTEAIAAYRKAATLSGTEQIAAAEALIWAAETALAAKDLPQAATLYQEVADRYPQTEQGSRARFEQARCLFDHAKYVEAAAVFQVFVTEHPEHALVWHARLQAGIAGKQLAQTPEEFSKAAAVLLEIARTCPDAELAMQAFLESFQAQQTAGKLDAAAEILQEAIKQQPESKYLHLLKYQLAAVNFQLGREEQAVQTADDFFAHYPELPLAADLYLLTGDYFASAGDYARAQTYYSKLHRPPFDSVLVPVGMYENARCSFLLDKLDNARELLNLLLTKGEGGFKLEPLLQAKAEFLMGDVLAKQGNYEEARKFFAFARNNARDHELGFAALGRQAEMLMSLAVNNPASWDKAIECLNEILKPENSASAGLREMARYRLGKCLEGKGDTQGAILIFQELYLNYVTDRDAGKIRNWQYYYLSIFDLTRLLERKGDLESLRKAARLYEDLAASNLPRSAEAAIKAKMIREKHNLGEGH